MFILRKVSGRKLNGGIEHNFNLGESYSLVTKEENPEEFKNAIERGDIVDDPIIYGYVIGKDCEMHQLSVQQESYIMTDSGKTFSNLSLK